MTSKNRAVAEEGSATLPEHADSSERQPDEATAEPAQSATPALTLDILLEVAQNERRRRILEYLATHDGSAEIGDVAEHLAVLEYDCPDSGPTSTQRKRMYVGLYQGHLPKMDEMGVVEFDKDRGLIEAGPHARKITRFVERATGEEPRWPLFYLVQAAFAGVLFALSVLWPASSPVATAAIGVVIVLLVLTAAWHLRWRRWMSVPQGDDRVLFTQDKQ